MNTFQWIVVDWFEKCFASAFFLFFLFWSHLWSGWILVHLWLEGPQHPRYDVLLCSWLEVHIDFRSATLCIFCVGIFQQFESLFRSIWPLYLFTNWKVYTAYLPFCLLLVPLQTALIPHGSDIKITPCIITTFSTKSKKPYCVLFSQRISFKRVAFSAFHFSPRFAV